MTNTEITNQAAEDEKIQEDEDIGMWYIKRIANDLDIIKLNTLLLLFMVGIIGLIIIIILASKKGIFF